MHTQGERKWFTRQPPDDATIH